MECKFCGKPVQEDFIFCPYCGNRLDGKKVCPGCGSEILCEFRYCPVCGADTVETESETVRLKPLSGASKSAGENSGAKKVKKPSESVKKRLWASSLVTKVLFLTVSAVIFICSFFSVVTFDMTDLFGESTVGTSQSLRLRGKIKVDYSAVDLISFACFSTEIKDYYYAEQYLTDHEYEISSYEREFYGIMADDDYIYVNEDTGVTTITSKGCRRISGMLSEVLVLKIAYADEVYAAGEGAEISGIATSLRTAGFLALVNIICSGTVFLYSLLNMLPALSGTGALPVSLTLGAASGFWAVLSGSTVDIGYGTAGASMGGALACMVAFAVVFIAFSVVRKLLSSEKILTGERVSNVIAAVVGVVILCCSEVSAVDVTMSELNLEQEKTAEFTISYSQTETLDQYFYDVGADNYYDESRILSHFLNYAKLYGSDVDECEAMIKENIGMNGLINTDFLSETNGYARPLLKVQPVLSVIGTYFAALLMAAGLAGLINEKRYKVLKIAAVALMIVPAVYAIFTPILLDKIFAVSTISDILKISVGAAPVVQLCFAVVGALGIAVAAKYGKKSAKKDFTHVDGFQIGRS